MRKALKFFLLPYSKKKLFIQTFFLVGLIRLGLWVVPYRLLIKWLKNLGSIKSIAQTTNWKLVSDVSRSVITTSRFIPSASCLTQALATQTILRLNGHQAGLKFGVDKDASEKLIAHAWIEIDGKIIIGSLPNLNRYSVLGSGHKQFV